METHYIDRGDPKGLPVVLIHGFPFSHEMWEPQVAALKARYRVIAYDVRGHGKSSVGDGLYTLEYFVDDLLGLLDRLKVGKAVLCGLSMGGYIALRALERAPERVRALILCDTRSEADGNQGKVLRAGAMKAVAENGVPAFAEGFATPLFAPATLAAARPCVEKVKALIRANSPLGIRGTLLALAARTDATAFLPSIKVPTLILVGEKDVLTPPALSEAMHKAIPGSRLRALPEAGHLSNLENPAAFNAALLEFLGGL